VYLKIKQKKSCQWTMERIIGKNNKGFMVYDLPVIGVLEEK
jgi:hypothetical protein